MQSRMNVRNMAFLAVAGARKKSPNVHDHDWRAVKTACRQRTIALSCQTKPESS